ncbi:MAG: hypothetical protein K0R54_3320 [Clostridiaceae bacterium]|nr:hypothetical protein [Clostridiaceae bacterium]
MNNEKIPKQEYENIINNLIKKNTLSKEKITFGYNGKSKNGLSVKCIKRLFLPKRRNGLSSSQISYLVAHELAHIEFKETLSFWEKVRNCKSTRVKSIINETMCDIRGIQLVKLDVDEIENFFGTLSNDLKACYDGGYFTADVRKAFVIEYLNNGFTIEKFKSKLEKEYKILMDNYDLVEELDLIEVDRILHYYFVDFKI